MGMKSPVFARHKMNVGGYRKNARCPNCFSSDRSRLMYLFFQYRTEVYRKPTKMLHISPEVEVGKLFADKPNIEYIAGTIEPDPYMELHPIHLDVTDITFPENQFDLVICNHVIEHVPDDRKAMQEIFRVLKPGGICRFAGSHCPGSGDNHRESKGHLSQAKVRYFWSGRPCEIIRY